MCLPSQTCYVVISGGQPPGPGGGARMQPRPPWYERLWDSVQQADRDRGPVIRGRPAVTGPGRPAPGVTAADAAVVAAQLGRPPGDFGPSRTGARAGCRMSSRLRRGCPTARRSRPSTT